MSYKYIRNNNKIDSKTYKTAIGVKNIKTRRLRRG